MGAGQVVLDSACDQLRDRLTTDRGRAVRFSALRRLYPYLLDRIGDTAIRSACHLDVAAIAALPVRDRRPGSEALVKQILKSDAPEACPG